jgi:hypothetical protein
MPTPKTNTPESAPDEVITKYRVTMRNIRAVPATPDNPAGIAEITATDYVPIEILDAYLENARGNWAQVEVSEEPDAGPGGYHGATYIPENLPVPDAGTMRPATD